MTNHQTNHELKSKRRPLDATKKLLNYSKPSTLRAKQECVDFEKHRYEKIAYFFAPKWM